MGYARGVPTDEQLIESGRAAGQREYWKDVKGWAAIRHDETLDELRGMVARGELDPHDEADVELWYYDLIYPKVWQAAENYACVVPRALAVLQHGAHQDAYEEMSITIDGSMGYTNVICEMAKPAAYRDIMREVTGPPGAAKLTRAAASSKSLSARKRKLLGL